jgi:hypothetical protein
LGSDNLSISGADQGRFPSRSPGADRVHIGRTPLLARIFWILSTALAVAVYAGTFPARRAQLAELSKENRHALATLHLSESGLVDYVLALDSLVMIAFTLIAAVIFWRRSGNPAALFVSLTLMALGARIVRPGEGVERVWLFMHLPVTLLFILATITMVFFLFIFPDGRFVPLWSVWVAVAWSIGVVVWHVWPMVLGRGVPWPAVAVPYPIATLALGVGVVAQVHRYRRVASPSQRQQTKWVVLGLSVTFVGVAIFLVLTPVLVPSVTDPGMARVLYVLIGVPFFYLSTLLVPVSIGLSILRYQLWDIDTIINRALVYGLLTGLLLTATFGSVVMLQAAFRALTGQESQLAIVISTLAAAALFQPLRNRLQDFIDRRFYRYRYDASQAIEAFNARVRDEVDLAAITEDVYTVVRDTVRPTSISLWLRDRGPDRSGKR